MRWLLLTAYNSAGPFLQPFHITQLELPFVLFRKLASTTRKSGRCRKARLSQAPQNFVVFRPGKNTVTLSIRLKQSGEVESTLEQGGLGVEYDKRKGL